MQQWGRIAILAAMFVTAYLLILAWQKDYGKAPQANQQAATAVVAPQGASASSGIPNASANTGTVASGIPVATKTATACACFILNFNQK